MSRGIFGRVPEEMCECLAETFARSCGNQLVVRGIFGCVPEETRTRTFQVIPTGERVQALKVSHMSFIIASYFGQLVCFVPRSRRDRQFITDRHATSEDMTRETLSVSINDQLIIKLTNLYSILFY